MVVEATAMVLYCNFTFKADENISFSRPDTSRETFHPARVCYAPKHLSIVVYILAKIQWAVPKLQLIKFFAFISRSNDVNKTSLITILFLFLVR